jgi:hypothetical protein
MNDIAAAGQVARVLFATTAFPTNPPQRLVALTDANEEIALGPPGGAGLPPLLTFPCYEVAREQGLGLIPGVVVTDAAGALLQLRWPPDHYGAISIGMARLTQDLIRGMFAAMQTPPPVLMTLDEAAALIRVTPDTLKHMVADLRIRKSVKRGRPLIFVRDLLVQEWMAIVIAGLIKRKAENNDFDCILVHDASRLTRVGAAHSSKLRYDLEQAGIGVVAVMGYMPKNDYSDVKDAMDSVVARQQAKSIAAGVARGSQSAIEQGRKAHCSAAPYGLDKQYLNASGQPLHVIRNLSDGSQQRLHPSTGEVLDTYGRNETTGSPVHYKKQKSEVVKLIPGAEDRVEVVHRIYRRHFCDGWGIWRIANELNNLNVASPTGLDWSRGTVRSILRNPIYSGRGITNRSTIALYYCRDPDMPREVSPGRRTPSGRPAQTLRPSEDWKVVDYPDLVEYLPNDIRDRAAARHSAILDGQAKGGQRSARDKHVGSDFFLKRILKTKEGLSMTGQRKGRKKKTYRYYAVTKAYSAPRSGTHLSRLVPAEPIEHLIMIQLKNLLMDMPGLRDEFMKATKAQLARRNGGAADRGKLETEIRLVERRIGMALDQMDGNNDDAIRQKLAELKVQRRKLGEELSLMAEPVEMTEREIEDRVDAMIAACNEQADILAVLPREQARELLELLIESLTVDLETMEFNCVLRLPSSSNALLAAVGASQPMGLADKSVYRLDLWAHPPAEARRVFRFWLGRRAA